MPENRAPLMPADMGVIQPPGYAVPVVYRVLADGAVEARLLGEASPMIVDDALRAAIDADRARTLRHRHQ